MLELQNVSKQFNLTSRKEDLRVALDHVSLTIEAGEFVTIIGSNGSGKSTTMNIISGVMKPDEGKVRLNGVDITNLSEYKRASYFGRVFQDPMMGTAGDMSVLENLEIAYRRGHPHLPFKWGFNKAHRQIFVDELKRFDLGLETRLNQKVGVMSGGQRQALTLLMATMRKEQVPSRIRKDYILFSGDANAKEELDQFAAMTKQMISEVRNNPEMPEKEKKAMIKHIRDDRRSEFVNKYDITKQILLLDEHTAALDPKTAKKVLELTDKIVHEKQMTTLMITHNMKDAITYGNRLIMFHMGHIIYDVKGEEKQKLTVEDLLEKFEEADKLAGI